MLIDTPLFSQENTLSLYLMNNETNISPLLPAQPKTPIKAASPPKAGTPLTKIATPGAKTPASAPAEGEPKAKQAKTDGDDKENDEEPKEKTVGWVPFFFYWQILTVKPLYKLLKAYDAILDFIVYLGKN